ncbi:YpiF family protein [Radiobacillus kanasensis]|uniref:DUF2487 family protein n=1 Tax=Radiobacillus kanasensis TaxID=2844358 RepID=UPI001E3D9B29|nr:DUF2487 family protein [Radiobacillus kanasensis]UFU01296.1 YpiF family protein [Radiobacillus kanasensis]
MQWKEQDMHQYIEAQEYVDTLVIPLIPIQLEKPNEIVKHAAMSELTEYGAKAIENQFKGRIFLSPSFQYFKSSSTKLDTISLQQWIAYYDHLPFKHVFLFTFDHAWKKVERELNASLLWLPAISGKVEDAKTSEILKEQLNQMMDLIQSYWQE